MNQPNPENNRTALLHAVGEQQGLIEGLRRTIASQNLVIDYIAHVAGLSQHVAAIRRTADLDNPAQPYPNPPEQPPSETTEQAAIPEAYDNVQSPGMTPGSVQHLPAETTGTPMDPGATLPTAPYNQLVDVQAPVTGTQSGEVPLEQVRTEVDVRVGDPMNPEVAFPLNGKQSSMQTPEDAANRTMASLRLARLRIQSGTAAGDDIQVAASIEADGSRSTADIESEINTLAGVVKAAARRTQRPAGAVPKAASAVQRTTPSLVQQPGLAVEASASPESDAEDIFL